MVQTHKQQGLTRFYAVLAKIWERGPIWFLRRIKREFFVPSTGPTKTLRNIRVAFEHTFFRKRSSGQFPAADVLYFFYDLEICPITYDMVTYLAIAEMCRRREGLAGIHVVIVPGTVNGLREEVPEYEAAINHESRHWRLHNLVIPLFRLLPTCTGYTVYGTRQEAIDGIYSSAGHIFPEGYSVSRPVGPRPSDICDAARAGETVHPLIRATPQGLSYMRQFLEPRARGRRIVVINLRRYAFMPARDSQDENWFAFAKGLDSSKWMPVFVLDTDVALDLPPPALDDFVVCHAVPWSIGLRMALYELADLTMAIAQGPMELCWLNDRCRYAFFVRPGSSPHTTDETFIEHGFEPGKDPPYAVAGQRWIWASDDLPVIRSVFSEMTSGMDGKAR